MKIFLKTYFNFSKKECNGIFILCVLLFSVILFPLVYSRFQKPEVYNFTDFEKELKAFENAVETNKTFESKNLKNNIQHKKRNPIYFEFNPNGLSEAQWRQLGLSDRQVKVIKNYELKGGRFYRKEDLQKIYSIKPEEYAQLEPYIVIPPTSKNKLTSRESPSSQVINSKNIIIIDINTADSIQLTALRTITPNLAARIIKYRTLLGGFHRKEQLLEVYGIDSVKYQRIQAQINLSDAIQKIKINTVTLEELKKHPYFRYKQAKAIIQYRKQHGNYQTLTDLTQIAILDDSYLSKIAPYLDFTN